MTSDIKSPEHCDEISLHSNTCYHEQLIIKEQVIKWAYREHTINIVKQKYITYTYMASGFSPPIHKDQSISIKTVALGLHGKALAVGAAAAPREHTHEQVFHQELRPLGPWRTGCTPWKGPSFWRTVPWEGPHAGAGGKYKERVAETRCYELTTSPLSPVPLEEENVGESGIKERG